MKAAIYSRKSIFTGKGESIENQIELCKEYGNKIGVKEYYIYEDEGFSGKNTNRPKFQQLLKAVKKKEFDVLICYRLDRISRNVADFSSMLELLQQNNINFISIREQFDTTTPMGRAMVYIASVFAQLERETIAERVKDNMLQLAKTGRWLGGQEPYGFKAERVTYLDEEFKERSLMNLTPLENELNIVKLIYTKYLECRSITGVVKYMNLKAVKGKNGGDWASMQIKRLLSSPLYVKSNEEVSNYLRKLGINVFGEAKGNGYLTYNKTKNITQDRDISEWIAAVGRHIGVIEAETWLEVQNILLNNKFKKAPRLGTGDSPALLTGILMCAKCGANMKIKQGHKSKAKQNMRYDYYVCSNKNESYVHKCDNINVRTDRLDKSVINELKALNKKLLFEELSKEIGNDLSNNSSFEYMQNIKYGIEEREKSINALIKKLAYSKSEEVDKYILAQIENLNEEVKNLKKQLQNTNTGPDTLENSPELSCLGSISIDYFNGEYKHIQNLNEKRNLLKTVIDYVTWDGINNKFVIHLLESHEDS